MKKSISSLSIIAACIMVLFTVSSFKMIPSASSTVRTFDNKHPLNLFGHIASSDGGSTYYGTVVASGAINKTGTFEMPTQVLGMALHCTFILTFSDGTITIRMNCNMVTFNGQWKVLSGTGAYQNLKGGGSLIMPNNDDENLTGTVSGL